MGTQPTAIERADMDKVRKCQEDLLTTACWAWLRLRRSKKKTETDEMMLGFLKAAIDRALTRAR